MFIVINKDNITIKKTLKQLNKKLKTAFNKEDFKNYNNNYVLNCSDNDLDFKRDVNEISRIFVSKLYKKDLSNLIMYGFFAITIIMLLITITSISGVSKTLELLITQLSKVVIK